MKPALRQQLMQYKNELDAKAALLRNKWEQSPSDNSEAYNPLLALVDSDSFEAVLVELEADDLFINVSHPPVKSNEDVMLVIQFYRSLINAENMLNIAVYNYDDPKKLIRKKSPNLVQRAIYEKLSQAQPENGNYSLDRLAMIARYTSSVLKLLTIYEVDAKISDEMMGLVKPSLVTLPKFVSDNNKISQEEKARVEADFKTRRVENTVIMAEQDKSIAELKAASKGLSKEASGKLDRHIADLKIGLDTFKPDLARKRIKRAHVALLEVYSSSELDNERKLDQLARTNARERAAKRTLSQSTVLPSSVSSSPGVITSEAKKETPTTGSNSAPANQTESGEPKQKRLKTKDNRARFFQSQSQAPAPELRRSARLQAASTPCTRSRSR